jgi:hypothetical protein
MFCIATFIVFGILGIFSATYRPLAKAAWHCTWRRVRFRPCDISFSEEMRGKLLSKLVFTWPRVARFLDRWLDWISFAFVALSIWSLFYVANAGLNLWVYDTCNPSNAESCSLSGEACGVDQVRVGLIQAVREGRIGEWVAGPFVRLGETLSRIPDRLRAWNPQEYLAPTATFYRPRDPAKTYVLEILDPGCRFCKRLTENLKEAGIFDAMNVSYLLYSIKNPGEESYHFPNSLLMASYIEATKVVPLQSTSDVSGDWQLLESIFGGEGEGAAVNLQTQFIMQFTPEEAEHKLQELLRSIGYSAAEVERIAQLSHSPDITQRLQDQRRIVEEEIRTIKIPTLLLGERRFDRAVDAGKLKKEVPLPSMK